MPLAEMYDPSGRSAKRQNLKAGMLKVRNDYNFNLKTEMRACRESDVKLFKLRPLFQIEIRLCAEY